jgi:hypothetical protein
MLVHRRSALPPDLSESAFPSAPTPSAAAPENASRHLAIKLMIRCLLVVRPLRPRL